LGKSPSTLQVLARGAAWLAAAVVVAWLLSATLRTSDQISLGRIRISDPVRELNLQPFRNKLQPLRSMLQSPNLRTQRAARTYLFVDVLGNLAVFVPLGAALGAATMPGRRSRKTRGQFWLWWLSVTGAGLLLSLFIEIAQLAIPSRVTDVDDVILNTLGTAAGALLGGHISRRAYSPAGTGQLRGVQGACNTEIGQQGYNRMLQRFQLHAVRRTRADRSQQDISWFDIPMDHALCVCIGQCARDRLQQVRCLLRSQPAALIQQISQALAFHQFHADIRDFTFGRDPALPTPHDMCVP
jgi:hypothetical protein